MPAKERASKRRLCKAARSGRDPKVRCTRSGGPSLYEETRDMVEISAFAYVFANLRKLHEKGVIETQEGDGLVRTDVSNGLPVDATDIYALILRNEVVLRQEYGEARFETVVGALRRLIAESQEQHGMTGAQKKQQGTKYGGCRTNKARSLELVAFDDKNHEKEVVYGITVNHVLKRITVVFRGTVTKTDLLMDAKFGITRVRNPLRNNKHQTKKIGLHTGFKTYLFGPKGCQNSKYDKIVGEVISLLERHRGYKLYVTGHSLGGSLATLFAFRVAASRETSGIPKPITCIPIASPKVGDSSFRNAFHSLEKNQHIRCIRVENDMDIIPIFGFFNPVYRHVGVRLRLYQDRPHQFKATVMHDGRKMVEKIIKTAELFYKVSGWVITGGGSALLLESHSCPQHLQRLERERSKLHRGRLSCFVQHRTSAQSNFRASIQAALRRASMV